MDGHSQEVLWDVTTRIGPPRTKSGSRCLESHPPDEQLCPCCKGTRYVLRPDSSGRYGDGHERFSLVDCPVCHRDAQQQYLERLCGLSSEMRGWSYANSAKTVGTREAFEYGQQLAAAPQWFYSLSGPFGTGKTRLLACLVNAGRTNGWTSVYTTMAELFDHLRSTYAPGRVLDFDGIWEKVVKARILAIDECDRWNPTEWAEEKFFELIEIRYRHGAERCTAFATNTGVDSFDGYLASRMHDRRSRIYLITGGDWRR